MAGNAQSTPLQKQWTKSEKSKRVVGTSKTIEEKKEKPKTAPAGGGIKPPSKPPKKTGGFKDKEPNKYTNEPQKKTSKNFNYMELKHKK
jgi:hypothetical protein